MKLQWKFWKKGIGMAAIAALTLAMLTSCSSGGTAASSAASSAAASSAASSEPEKPSSSEPASSSEAVSSSESTSSSEEPEEPKPAYSKVEVLSATFSPKTYTSISTVTVTVNGYSHVTETRTQHYEIEAKVSLKNSGNMDRTVDSSNFAAAWDGMPLEIEEVQCNGMSNAYFTTLKAGEAAVYTITIPITEDEYNDWTNFDHVITLSSMFGELDAANDTYVVYQYLTASNVVSRKK